MRSRTAIVVVGAVAAAAVAWRRMRPFPVLVEGPSMEPTIPAGALLAVTAGGRGPRPGDVVVARLPDGREMVKRVLRIGPKGYELAGDNPASSTDSRHFGPVPVRDVAGRAIAVYWPPSSWRLL